MTAPSRRAWVAAVPGGLLVLLAIWEIVVALRTTAPGDDAWAAAAAVVRARHRPGDLIVFAPAWADPIGRLHLGDLIPVDMAARMDAARYGRIWEVAIRGAHAPETAGLAPAEVTTGDGVAVRFYERAAVEVLADVRDRLAQARVDGPARPTLELAEVGFAPHRCIQVVPAAYSSVRITFPGLPAGELVGYVGLADVFTRRDIRAPGRLVVEVAGQTVADVAPGVDDGWVRFAARIRGGDVAFIASATAGSRLICFAAEVRR
jgi:hypothetical protein